MALDFNKYIKTLKKDKKLLVPIIALIVVFGYFSLADFFKTSSGKVDKNPSGSIALEEKYFDERDVINANSKITESDEKQRKLIVEEELEHETKVKNSEGDGSYIKKIILNDKENNDLKINSINKTSLNSLNGEEDLPNGCKKDMFAGLVICQETDGTSTFLNNGERIKPTETLCQKPQYDITKECIDLKDKLKKEKEELEAKLLAELENDKIKTNKQKVAQQQKNTRTPVENFGSDKNSKSYKKNQMLLGLVTNDEANIIESRGSSYIGVENLLDRQKDRNSVNDILSNKEPKLFIKPGSSYIGTLINPLNSLYKQVKPIINIEAGDLAGYRIVGEITSNEASGGLIITGNKVVSPNGVEENVNFVAIRNNDGELTPLFVDEIDRHLMGKIGYTVLGALANDYSSQLSGNNMKDDNSINLGDTTTTETGEQLSGTFSEIARQYKTEIKVNPQTMIIIFY